VHDLANLLKTLGKVGPSEQIHAVYEAGPTGDGLQRALQAKGYSCAVVAPSQMSKWPTASRVKTDGRGSLELAGCSRAGPLRSRSRPKTESWK
jgi:transposase